MGCAYCGKRFFKNCQEFYLGLILFIIPSKRIVNDLLLYYCQLKKSLLRILLATSEIYFHSLQTTYANPKRYETDL